MFKKAFSVVFCLMLFVSTLIPFSFAVTDSDWPYDQNLFTWVQAAMDGRLEWSSDCGVVPKSLTVPRQYARGGGAGRIEGPGSLFGGGSAIGPGAGRFTEYDTSSVVRTPIVSTTNNTTYLNMPTTTYNNTTNNYYNQYEINNITYNNEYNVYNFQTTNNYNYYVTYSPTYVTITNFNDEKKEAETDVYYYELPDGRASFDLKAEDIWGTVFSYNCVSATKVLEDDGVTLGLWHFDGNLKDSSALASTSLVSNSTNFVTTPFGSGLSLNGETSITLPYSSSSMVGKTLEFRVYSNVSFKSFGSLTYNLTTLNYAYTNGFRQTRYGMPKINFSDLSVSIPALQWNTIAICYVSDSYAIVYVNGQMYCDLSSYSVSKLKLSSKVFVPAGSFNNYMGNIYTLAPSDAHIQDVYYPLSASTASTFVVDEMRISNKFLYYGPYVPSTQPFDTNEVLVFPSTANENDIAIKGSLPVSGFRVGGVRPTYPDDGYVYVFLEENKIKSVQQYQNDGWYNVDAAVRKDGEWVTAKNYDISDATIEKPDPPPDSENPDGGDEGDKPNVWDKLIQAILDFVGKLIELLVGLITKLLEGIVSLFDNLLAVIERILTFLTGGFTDFLKAFFYWCPPALVDAFTLMVLLGVVLAVIRFFIGG